MNGKRKNVVLCYILFICLLLFTGCSMEEQPQNVSQQDRRIEEKGLEIHYIDVDQGSSALIEMDGHYMLVDAGEKDQGEVVVDYLKKENVSHLDYVVGTHPHSDHIGGMAYVLQNVEADNLLIPEKEHTTKAFENMLDAAEKNEMEVIIPKQGETYSLGDASFTILSLNKDYEDELNNWSIVFQLKYKDTSFLFSGDAEEEAEHDICETGVNLKSDVYLVGHHGSHTSTSAEFLEAISPKYAVISCGVDNSYGHPKPQILTRLEEANIQIFRTDLQGSIVAYSDGKKITWNGEGASQEETSAQEERYILNTATKKFHLPSCSSVDQTKEENKKEFIGTREKLIEQGYESCKNCNP
jgi:competence protein ComEC